MSIDKYKVWYITIIWRPNTGKSTFINTLIWEKVSIVSSIPQTTRKKVLWIYNTPEAQIIFIDTPWIHSSAHKFNQKLNDEALWGLEQSDVILYFVDSMKQKGEEEKFLEEVFEKVKKPKIKVFTKIDTGLHAEAWFLTISSLKKKGFDPLLEQIISYLPTSPLLYPQEYYTSQTMDERSEEIVREKIFLTMHEEIPHSVFVKVEEIEDTPKILKILCYIFTETESQKTIIIWKGGSMLTKIGKEARLDLEKIFWRKVFLSLRLKVSPKWRQDEALLNRMFIK